MLGLTQLTRRHLLIDIFFLPADNVDLIGLVRFQGDRILVPELLPVEWKVAVVKIVGEQLVFVTE